MPDIAALLAAYDAQLRPAETARLRPGVHVESDGPVKRIVGRRRGFISAPPDLGLDGAELDALITRQRDFFAARGEEVEWKTRGHDRPAGIPARLRAAGFVAEPTETVVIAEAAGLTEPDPVLPPGVVVREVTDEADIPRIAAVAAAVFGDDPAKLTAELLAQFRSSAERAVHVIAEASGEVVSVCRLEFEPGTAFAGLWGGATLPHWRRRGLYHAMVGCRARIAAAHGTRYLQVDASDQSRPILQKLGFTAVTTTTPYLWKPSR